MDLGALVTEALDQVDLTSVVVERVDLATVVNAALDTLDITSIVMDRVDLPLVATTVIEEIDLAGTIRDSTGSAATEAVRGVRMTSVDADRAIARLVDRFTLRRKDRRLSRRAVHPTETDARYCSGACRVYEQVAPVLRTGGVAPCRPTAEEVCRPPLPIGPLSEIFYVARLFGEPSTLSGALPNPQPRALTIASPRVAAWSFERIVETLLRTVFGARNSR